MVSEEEIQAKMRELDREMGGLLEEETLRRFAMSSLGIQTPKSKKGKSPQIRKLADLKDREEVTVHVVVSKVPAPRAFTKKDGSPGRVVNISVKDETGSCRLALWDNEADMIANLPIETGTKLCCEQCYVKMSEYGIDIGLGRSGKITKL